MQWYYWHIFEMAIHSGALIMYKLPPVFNSEEVPSVIIRVSDRTFIPFDPANTDYREYLAWLAEGNEPLPADEPPAAE
jgi:hypothetical protein